jgi:hypothetical protein
VIVQYKVTPTFMHHQQAAALGGSLLHHMESIKGAHYSIPASRIAELAESPDVAYISPNRPLKAMFDQITDGTVYSSWANSNGFTGAGVGVAIIDSGIVDLPDFHSGSTDRIVYSQSFIGGTAVDQYGHGTHVAGILAGNGNGTVYIGTAPQANIVNLRVLDVNGQGTDAGVIQAIETAISLKSKYNIRAINLSLGRPVFEPAAMDPLRFVRRWRPPGTPVSRLSLPRVTMGATIRPAQMVTARSRLRATILTYSRWAASRAKALRYAPTTGLPATVRKVPRCSIITSNRTSSRRGT